MPTTATMTIRVSSETKRIIDGIRRGLADVEAGRVVSHDEAGAEIQAVIEAAKTGGA